MRRRMRDEGASAVQQFVEDFLPLILLFAISITGLLLAASYTWMKGYGYEFLSLLHAITVIFTLLWLPFGKFFHIFQRPAQLGVSFYKDAGKKEEAAKCRRCGTPFTSKMHVQDLIEVERKLGFQYEMEGTEHYQWICPPCRRAALALAQGKLSSGTKPQAQDSMPAPEYANPGMKQRASWFRRRRKFSSVEGIRTCPHCPCRLLRLLKRSVRIVPLQAVCGSIQVLSPIR